MKAAVLTVSDGVSEGTREDRSGDVLEELLAGEGFEVVRRVVPDDRDAIADAIAELTAEARVVLTTGGRLSDDTQILVAKAEWRLVFASTKETSMMSVPTPPVPT